MNGKPSLYAALPAGTKLFINTHFVAPSSDWASCECEVVEDLGEDVVVFVEEKEALSRRVPQRFVLHKSRILGII